MPARATGVEVTYSQIGSRGLPWTSRKPSRSRVSGWAASQALVSSRDRRAGPLHGPARVHVEGLDLAAAQGGGVVVAAHADGAQLAEPRDDLVGVRPVAHDVAQVPHLVHGWDRGEDGVERDQVRVDVGEDGDAHRVEGSAAAGPRERSEARPEPRHRGRRRRSAGVAREAGVDAARRAER